MANYTLPTTREHEAIVRSWQACSLRHRNTARQTNSQAHGLVSRFPNPVKSAQAVLPTLVVALLTKNQVCIRAGRRHTRRS